jgi:hypothetical protein
MSKPKTLVLPDSLRQQLKKPFGQLVTGSISECNRVIETAIQEEAPPTVVLVGDTVSRHAIEAGIRADLIIVDNMEMRQSSAPVSLGPRKTFRLINSQGTIAAESWDVISGALNAGDSAVVVEGEEDLLVLVAASIAPIRSFVVYGQPNVGVVLVRVSVEKKHEVAKVQAQMKEVTSA